MNENIDLIKILEGCPEGTLLYSPIFGEVEFYGICTDSSYPIVVEVTCANGSKKVETFTEDGYYQTYLKIASNRLLPSKIQRDWSKFERFWDKPEVERFDPRSFQPFDKVLVRYEDSLVWHCDFIETYHKKDNSVECINGPVEGQCIPYNDETKHLVGTTNDCPDYYKWWEE